jgi:putative NADH-flavin reductase
MQKKIVVFGASGKTGKVFLKKALEMDNLQITAFVRNPESLSDIQNNKFSVLKGDVLDMESVENAVINQDVLVVLLGTKGNKPTTVYSEGTMNMLQAMKKYQVKKMICLSSAGVMGNDAGFVFTKIIIPLFLKHPFKDKRKQIEMLLANKDIDWVIVRPPEIVDKPQKNDFKVSLEKTYSDKITVGDLVDFLITQIDSNHYIRQMPFVSN